MDKTIKIQIITDHLEYKTGQIVLLDEKNANILLTNSKALRIHRKSNANNVTEIEIKTEESSENKISEKGNKKIKNNNQ